MAENSGLDIVPFEVIKSKDVPRVKNIVLPIPGISTSLILDINSSNNVSLSSDAATGISFIEIRFLVLYFGFTVDGFEYMYGIAIYMEHKQYINFCEIYGSINIHEILPDYDKFFVCDVGVRNLTKIYVLFMLHVNCNAIHILKSVYIYSIDLFDF